MKNLSFPSERDCVLPTHNVGIIIKTSKATSNARKLPELFSSLFKDEETNAGWFFYLEKLWKKQANTKNKKNYTVSGCVL